MLSAHRSIAVQPNARRQHGELEATSPNGSSPVASGGSSRQGTITMTIEQRAKQTLRVLELQQEYFQSRSPTKLSECRDAERRLKEEPRPC